MHLKLRRHLTVSHVFFYIKSCSFAELKNSTMVEITLTISFVSHKETFIAKFLNSIKMSS